MPPGGVLPKEEIADFAKWIDAGAVWPSGSKTAGGGDEKHWAFQPVTEQPAPAVSGAGWVLNEIDAFIASRLEAAGLEPAPQADRRTLLRRLSFDLTGLPPRPEQIHAFVHSKSPTAYLDAVGRLLDSDRFGEHWARHWMDWVRYSESHGSQGDFALPQAWRYRDYLIRAFNSDVPYDRMLLEYLAGDLLPDPRLNEKERLNESILGLGNLRMVEYGYVPVDALDDQVKVVDNQIDVLSKAFQGLTISCARCHDHKFDPITQKDFYALYGVFASSRHGLVTVDSPEVLRKGRGRLEELRGQIRARLSEHWTKGEGAAAKLLKQVRTSSEDEDPRLEKLKHRLSGEQVDDPLQPWRVLQGLEGEAFRREWGYLREVWLGEAEIRQAKNRDGFRTAWDLTNSGDYEEWFPNGPGAPAKVSSNGEIRVQPDGDEIIAGLLPAGIHTGLDSRKYGAIVGSPRFLVSSDYISVRVVGDNYPSARLVVENYPIGDGGIHPAVSVDGDRPQWIRFDTAYRQGENAHLEFQTLDERSRPFWFNPKKPDRKASDDGRSSFGVVEVVFHDKEESPRELPLAVLHVLDREPPPGIEDLEALYDRLIRDAVAAWSGAELDDRQTAFLDFAIRTSLVPTVLEELTELQTCAEDYRRLEEAAPIPRRAPGVLPGTNFDQPLFTRGDHRNPAEPVERRYLELFGAEPFQTEGSGRLELARALASADNPLTARVMVNRLWSYIFGQGIVGTVDNFGATGDKPSHPELLDYLAKRFVDGGWSIKKMIRFLVLSRTYQMSSTGSAQARALDPRNLLLRHQNFRRLPAESIRDAILEISGELDTTMYGPSINVYYVGKTEGGGKKGPLDGSGRRSVYQGVRRNSQNPFLQVFDAPKPSTTRGKRDVTNIPAQSLAMLNDPFVVDQAAKWAKKALADGAISSKDRAVRMFRRALGRDPEAPELELLMASIEIFAQERRVTETELMGDQDLWKDYAQSLLNLKEFIYLR